MSWFEIVLLVLILILIFLPPKWDPAIRLKELNENKHKKKS